MGKDRVLAIDMIETVSLSIDEEIVVEKEAISKKRYYSQRLGLFDHIHSSGMFVKRFVEIHAKDSLVYEEIKQYPYYESAQKMITQWVNEKAAIVIELSSQEPQIIEYVSQYKPGEFVHVPIKVAEDDYQERIYKIMRLGTDEVYAQSVLGIKESNNICEISKISGGKVVASPTKCESDSNDKSSRFITTKDTMYPVITEDIPFPRITDIDKQSVLDEGAILFLAQSRLEKDLLKPIFIPHRINAALSSKLFIMNINGGDTEYSRYLYDYFCNSNNNVLKQLTRIDYSLSIQQFKSLYVPTKQYFTEHHVIDYKKHNRLEELSVRLAKAQKEFEDVSNELKSMF